MQSNRKFAETIRDSQESLLRSSQDLAYRESRESLLKRYSRAFEKRRDQK
jgi:hypothetical protein